MAISKAEAVAAFAGNGAALARFLGISQQAVSDWGDGPIPELRELQLRVRMPEVFGPVPTSAPVGPAAPAAKVA